MATSDTYEFLEAQNSIVINKPIEEVWRQTTKPGEKFYWIGDSNKKEYIVSGWEEGDEIFWKQESEETGKVKDYYKGIVTKIENNKLIEIQIHNAYEEYLSKKEGWEPDLGEETWTFIFEPLEDKTKLTLKKSDYDEDHIIDDLHEHEEAVKSRNWEEENTIPGFLKKIKIMCEK